MAWAEKLASGKYRGCWRNPDGTQGHTTRKTHPEHPWSRKRDAVEAAQEEEVKARRKASAKKGTIKASTLWGDWWDLIVPEYPDSDAAKPIKSIVDNHVRPRWGEVALNEMENRDVKAWVADLLAAPGRQVSYVRKIHWVLSWSLSQAVDRGVLTASPCVGIKIPRPPKRKKPYTDDAFVAAIRPHLPQCYRDIIDLGEETGLRPGELCGLHADMCDLGDGWLTVSKVLVERRRVIRHYPKDKDDRGVPLTDKAIGIIVRNLAGRDLKAGCGLEHSNSKPCTSVLVIRNSFGGVITPTAWRNAMMRAADKADVPVRGRTPYAVRRKFGTRAARGGMDAFELAELMGHADVRQTQEYVQETPAARDRLRLALGETPGLNVVRGQSGAELGHTSTTEPHKAPNDEEEKNSG